MSVIYKKATTREQVIKYIRDLDIYHIKKHGTVLVLPFTDKETKKLIVKELKRLGICKNSWNEWRKKNVSQNDKRQS